MRKETTLGNTHPRAVMAAVIRAVRRRGGVQFHADAAAARLKIMQRAVAAGDPGGDGDGGQGGLHAGQIGGRDAAAEEFGREGAVVGAGVGVEKMKPFAEGARGGGFARGGAAVDGDDEEG